MRFITAAGDTDTYWAKCSLVPVDWCFAVVSDCHSSTSVRSERNAPLLIQSQWSTPTTHREVPVNIHVSTYIHTYTHIHTYIHIYIHTYIHTYIRIQPPPSQPPCSGAGRVCCIISKKGLKYCLFIQCICNMCTPSTQFTLYSVSRIKYSDRNLMSQNCVQQLVLCGLHRWLHYSALCCRVGYNSYF